LLISWGNTGVTQSNDLEREITLEALTENAKYSYIFGEKLGALLHIALDR
jgi:hypothetical protein